MKNSVSHVSSSRVQGARYPIYKPCQNPLWEIIQFAKYICLTDAWKFGNMRFSVIMSEPLIIIPTHFREICIGKTISNSKIQSEFVILFNYKMTFRIEVVNSRFTRKKSIYMDGRSIHDCNKTQIDDLRYSWTHAIDGQAVEFTILPNTTNTGSDLRINGVDFFDYVYEVEVDEVADEALRKERGLTKMSTSLMFVVPSRSVSLSRPRPTAQASSENNAPSQPTTQRKAPSSPPASRALLDARRKLTAARDYAAFEDEDSFD